MAEQTLPVPKKNRLRLPLFESFWQNPVVIKELRSRMRGARAFILISIYLIILSCVVASIYAASMASSDSSPLGNPSISQGLGKGIFLTIAGFELLMVCFIAPAVTAGAITGEHERQTYDLLRTTLLSARALVLGKYLSSVSFILLLLVAAFPIQSLASMLGGVAPEEVLISFLILVISVIFFSALGLFFSCLLRRTLLSTVLSYATTSTLMFGIPMVVLFAFSFAAGVTANNTAIQNNLFDQVVVIVLGWLIIALNPATAGGATEIMLVEKQNALYTTLPLSNQALTNQVNFPIIAPWTGFVLFYLLASLVLIWISIRLVRRVER